MGYTSKVTPELAAMLIESGMRVKKAVHPERVITYGRAIDWIAENGYIITFTPFHTFALKGNIAYTWNISYANKAYPMIMTSSEQDWWDSNKGYGGSFEFAAEDSIKKAIEFMIRLRENPLL